MLSIPLRMKHHEGDYIYIKTRTFNSFEDETRIGDKYDFASLSFQFL